MAIFGRKTPETREKETESRSGARRPRSIRFSDFEWNVVEKAAARHGVSTGELVRSGAVAIAEERLGESPPSTLSGGHAALIEEIYRYVYILATLKREDMLDDSRGQDLRHVVEEARKAMAAAMESDTP